MGGGSLQHTGMAFGQRGLNRQPDGIRSGLGTIPGISCKRRLDRFLRPRTGIDPKSPCV